MPTGSLKQPTVLDPGALQGRVAVSLKFCLRCCGKRQAINVGRLRQQQGNELASSSGAVCRLQVLQRLRPMRRATFSHLHACKPVDS